MPSTTPERIYDFRVVPRTTGSSRDRFPYSFEYHHPESLHDDFSSLLYLDISSLKNLSRAVQKFLVEQGNV